MTPSRTFLAGATSFVAAPPVVIISALVTPTMSDDATDQVSGLVEHRSAMILGLTLNTVALVLLIAGTIWLAFALAPRSPKLAATGGVLGVLGSLVVMFENGVSAVAPSIVGALDASQATAVLDKIGSSAAAAGLEPVSVLGDIGLILLAVAAARIGVPRWGAAALALGAVGEGVGFATGTRVLVAIGFALVFAGAVAIVRVVLRDQAVPAAGATRAASEVAV